MNNPPDVLMAISAQFTYLDQTGQRHTGGIQYAEPLNRTATIRQLIADTHAEIQSNLAENGSTAEGLRITRFFISIDAAIRQ